MYHRLLKEAAFKKQLVKSVSMTTRAPRQGERHGRDYFFISERMFLYKRRAGHFLESERFFSAYYGTPAKKVREILKTGVSVLLCIDVNGAATVKQKASARVFRIFVKPPSLAALRQRLTARCTETLGDLKVRLQRAQQEMRCAKDYDAVLVNDDLEAAYAELKALVFKILAD